MSFNAYVPCNCRSEGKVSWPNFKDKLEIREGLIEVKSEHSNDIDLINNFDSWKLCEHNQIALEISMAQSIQEWKAYVGKTYPNRFPNFEQFIPSTNDKFIHSYDKQKKNY